MINIAIRATYYIFCCKNRNWDSPDLTQFWFFFLAFVLFLFLFLFLFCFCFCFFLFNNPISSSICKLPIRSEIYNCKFKNTNKVSIISSISSIIIIIIIIITFHNSLFLLTCTYEPLTTHRCLSMDTMSRIITALKELWNVIYQNSKSGNYNKIEWKKATAQNIKRRYKWHSKNKRRHDNGKIRVEVISVMP